MESDNPQAPKNDGPVGSPAVPSGSAAAPEPRDGSRSETQMQRLDSRLVPYWVLSNLFTTVVLIALLVGGVFYLYDKVDEYAQWLVVAAWTAGAALLLMALLQPVLAYMTWRYSMDDQLLIARYGILFREEKTIPISRLQHVDLRRGPIERLFSLATLVVFTAGTEGATFRVPGLSVARAQEMRDRILAARGDDVI